MTPAEPRPELSLLESTLSWYRRHAHGTLRYWLDAEVHVYAFSMAANMLLSFFPLLIVLVSLCRYVLHWPEAERAVYLALGTYFPDEMGAFVRQNLNWTVTTRGPFQLVSVVLLLFTANGIFLPLEVALNRAWGFHGNRGLLANQAISMGLIFVCGALAMMSTTIAAFNTQFVKAAFGGRDPWLQALLSSIFFRAGAVPLGILALFLIYWLLPNGRVPWRSITWPAVAVGLVLELMKFVNLILWPWLRIKLKHEYGPFYYSVSILLWGFLASMLILAGAEWAARTHRNAETTTASQLV